MWPVGALEDLATDLPGNVDVHGPGVSEQPWPLDVAADERPVPLHGACVGVGQPDLVAVGGAGRIGLLGQVGADGEGVAGADVGGGALGVR